MGMTDIHPVRPPFETVEQLVHPDTVVVLFVLMVGWFWWIGWNA